MTHNLCPLCKSDAVELRAQIVFWRNAFNGQRDLAFALTDRLTTAQNAALARDRAAQHYEPEVVTAPVVIPPTPEPRRRWRRP